jgi:hypothetical protein
MCEHMQHPNKHTCNICLKKEIKHLERMLQHTCTTIATCATSQSIFATSISNTCNIPLKHLKHTLAICAFNTTSPCCLAEWRLVGVWCLPAAVATRRGKEASATRAAGRPRPHDLERAAVRRDSKAAVRRAWAVRLRGPAAVRSEVADEQIRAIRRGTSG